MRIQPGVRKPTRLSIRLLSSAIPALRRVGVLQCDNPAADVEQLVERLLRDSQLHLKRSRMLNQDARDLDQTEAQVEPSDHPLAGPGQVRHRAEYLAVHLL